MLKRLVHDKSGSGLMWAALLIVILLIFAMLLYTVFSTASKVRSVEAELQRCASVALDKTTINSELRDVIITLRTRNIEKEVREKSYANGWNPTGSGSGRSTAGFVAG